MIAFSGVAGISVISYLLFFVFAGTGCSTFSFVLPRIPLHPVLADI
jgi:hypothetical protein